MDNKQLSLSNYMFFANSIAINFCHKNFKSFLQNIVDSDKFSNIIKKPENIFNNIREMAFVCGSCPGFFLIDTKSAKLIIKNIKSLSVVSSSLLLSAKEKNNQFCSFLCNNSRLIIDFEIIKYENKIDSSLIPDPSTLKELPPLIRWVRITATEV